MKVTVIGAGNVGATCADVIARKDFVDDLKRSGMIVGKVNLQK